MPQRKHSFRFRIPWLSAAPESSSRRLKVTSKSTSQSDTNVPIQRPSVITPPESSPSPTKTQQAPRRIEPQNKSPPHITHPTTPSSSSVIVETTQSKSPSPSTSPNHVNSPPPSLQQPSSSHDIMKVPKAEEITHPSSSASQQEKEKIVNKSEPIMPQEIEPKPEPEPEPEMKVNSPLRGITKSPETSFQPTQPVGFEQQASSMPSLSPVSKTEQTSEVLKSNHEETTTSQASSTSQEEKEKVAVAVSEKVPQEAEEPKVKSPLKIITKSPENLSTQHTATTLDEERSISKTPKAPLETQRKFLQHKEKEKEVHETKKVGKAKDTSTSQPNSLTKAFAPGTKDKKKHGVRETVERKIMFATSNSSGKDIGVVNSTDPRTSNVSNSSISPQRTVPSSEEREKEKGPLQKGIKDDITKFVHKIAASVHPTQPIEDKQFSVITLTGDNRGATMHVGSEAAKKEGSIHIHRAYKTDPDEESTEVTTDGEGNNTNTEEEDSMEDGEEVGKAYVNSNIQSINNSLMFHGSITERDPGVQVTLPQKPLESIKPNDKDTHNHRTEFNISRAQKSTYQPTVRRTCFRGLFHEPSDSDPDNPDKLRRHGCKFSCDKNNEDIEIM